SGSLKWFSVLFTTVRLIHETKSDIITCRTENEMGCGTSRDAVAAIETVVAPPAILDYPKPVVEDADSEQEAESSLKVIHESIVARGLEASAVGPPVISSAEECMALNGLPKCVCDLHDGMSQAIQQKPMRLLKITPVLSWAFLKVYEEIDPATECHQVPYVETDDNLWKEVVTVSWRWSEQKPAVYQQGFSPMSPEQFQEFSTLLKFAQENGIKYAWIDWSCVPQYTEDSMIEVHRSKVFYARARAMRVLPTFRRLPAEGPVRLTLVKAEKVLNKRADAGSIRCAVAASIIAAILAKNHVAGREYFGRVWTLAERMARFGRNEGLCQWLSLESWLGMVVDAMLKLTEDKTSSVIYKKMLGTKAADLLEAVLAPLAAAVRVGSVQTPAAEGLEAKVAELCMAAVSVWLSPNLLAEAPTSNWLHTYLGEEARSGVYQAWREADRVWAIYSYFCWKKNMDRSAVGLRIALEALVDIAAGDRSTYVRGMFAQLGVDANATPVMEIIPQPGKQTRPSSSSCSASRPPSAGGPPSVWPPSAHTQPTVGAKVTIKYAKVNDAKSAQSGHGGWAYPMEQMLGKPGVVESVNTDGDVRVKMDDGSGSMLWNPSLVMLRKSPAVVLYPSALSSVRIGPNAALNDKYTVRFVANSPDVGAVQADYPAPPSCLIYYFEVMVVEPGSNGTIGIGFTHSNHDVTRHVGWDAGTFGLHGDNGETYFEGCSEYYGFKYGKGDVVGAALDFQRKEIFFTKNGTKGKAISISISQALYPTVSLRSSGGFVSVNFGQKPFSFNIDPFKVLSPSALSSVRIGHYTALNDKYTVFYFGHRNAAGAVQADYPAPPSCLIYYFEVMVVEPGSNGIIGIGFTHSNHDVTHHVGWDAGTFGFHGDNGETYFEGCSEYYGFKYGKGDVVGAALDFQRKEIFFTKNGTKGKAISISISQALYPTVSLHSSGEVVSVNFGQKPFSFNIEPFKETAWTSSDRVGLNCLADINTEMQHIYHIRLGLRWAARWPSRARQWVLQWVCRWDMVAGARLWRRCLESPAW
ncbi:hypothetical protein Vafri_12242, partial [Volvox africanus]